MDFKEYLKIYNIEKKINKLTRKYKNKRVAIYGTGRLAEYLFENYDFTKLNIVAAVDKKYETEEDIKDKTFHNIPCVSPKKIKTLDIDLLLILTQEGYSIANYIFTNFITTRHSTTKVDWILKQNIFDYIKNKIKYKKPKQSQNEKYIFTFWEPKDKIPVYLQLCMNTWKKYLPDYKIVILNYNNLDKWLGYKYYDNYLFKNFNLAKQADAVRAAVLYQYGGIWMDTDTIITSDNIRKIIKQNSDVTMFGFHIGFILAKKKSKIIKRWLNEIKKNIAIHKLCKALLADYLLPLKQAAKLENWDYLGNYPLNKCFSKKYKIKSLDKLEYFALPECNYYKNTNKNEIEKYIEFYFKNEFSDYIKKNTKGIINLHNSWTPQEYKKMDKEEFLKQDNTLTKILLKSGK